MKIKIEGIDIHYKNVHELNERVRAHLTLTQDKRRVLEKELSALKKRERLLRKFVGGDEERPGFVSPNAVTPAINDGQ